MIVFNREFIGRSHGPDGPYEVSREKIRDCALSTLDPNPVYLDVSAAQAAGYPDVIAPPSFAVQLFFRYGGWPLYDPEFGKKKLPVCVHRAQSVDVKRHILPGDNLFQTTTIVDMYEIGPHDLFTMRHDITDESGFQVATVVNSIISRDVPGIA
ncbi:FAS1-like dehydratase domain-containing protein [Mycobacteroides abscessus]|uniref:FAS1-like dehydratase domain-containing protein n=1 Tax=Mycobacteroides abscessus TaxID=36809 RepID=UPI000C255E87|nr:MaoC family dehydratase N-terminal domain-containing protein [Mycobacteroides abscessus]